MLTRRGGTTLNPLSSKWWYPTGKGPASLIMGVVRRPAPPPFILDVALPIRRQEHSVGEGRKVHERGVGCEVGMCCTL